MIDAKELRIGNLIARKNYPHDHLRVEQIKWQSQIYFIRYRDKDDFGGESAVENFVPIPLNPEVLEACGFENMHPKSWNLSWESYDLQYSEYDKELGILSPDGCTSGHTVYFPCAYLHLLQNIYFFLTNTELEVNLNKEKV